MRPFDAVVSQLDYPMVVVTASAGGERAGCLVGFHTQCSIEPPRFLACLSVSNRTYSVTARSEWLAVHFLGRNDHGLARLFGEQTGDDTDKFESCAWRPDDRAPILTDVHEWFIGRVLDRVPLGDHVGHLLEPTDCRSGGALRQLSFQQVKDLTPGHPP